MVLGVKISCLVVDLMTTNASFFFVQSAIKIVVKIVNQTGLRFLCNVCVCSCVSLLTLVHM